MWNYNYYLHLVVGNIMWHLLNKLTTKGCINNAKLTVNACKDYYYIGQRVLNRYFKDINYRDLHQFKVTDTAFDFKDISVYIV